MHEPTQGVDVGARHEIFRLIRDAAANGVIVLVATSDHAQLAALCHRILIFRGGAISRELRGALSKGEITSAVYATSSNS
jgi:ribose transport system ATP-binding protein